MKKCSRCKEIKSFNEFNYKNKSLGLLQSNCKTCTRYLIRNHYNRNKEYYLDKTHKRNTELKLEIQAYIKEYLQNNPCVDCGETDIRVLEFDHNRDKFIKFKAVSVMMRYRYTLDKIREEVKKCEIRCANCHRRKTSKEFNWFKE